MPKRPKGNTHAHPKSGKEKRALLDKRRAEKRWMKMDAAHRLRAQREQAEQQRLKQQRPENWQQ